MQRSKILIVDDSAVVQSYFNELLDPLQYKLLPATTLKETQTQMRDHADIDIAVVDLNLPDASQGVVVDNAIRRGIPVIVLSGVEDAAVRERFVDKGIIDFVYKERKEDFEQVVQLIERLNLNKREKILIVDDSKTFRDYIREMLEAHCFIVIEAEDGLQGMKQQQQHEDLKMIISDYEMPVMNGLEMIRNIRQTTDALSLPIIIVSTRHEHDTACLKAGANDYIKKPFNRDEFLSRVYTNMTNKESMDTLDAYRLELEQYKKAIDQSTIVSKTDLDGRITYVNDEFCRVSGYSREELVGETHNIVRHPDIADDFYKTLWQRLKHKKTWKGVVKNRAKDGKAYYVDSVIMPILNINGEVEEFISIRKDVTRLVEQKLIIKNQTTDYRTHLPNREKLLQELEGIGDAALVL
ncbi:MAG: response regulator, partial [Sulfurimonadaceae bacterium]|nr:response regulator [Sulfurimonadaceae bacterium]